MTDDEARETERRITRQLTGAVPNRDQEWRDKLVVAVANDQPATILLGMAVGLLHREGNHIEKDLAARIQRTVDAFSQEARLRGDAARGRADLLAGTALDLGRKNN